jgi:polyribonucleotide nucleotidyltransferase
VGDGADDADCVVLTDILGAEDHFGCMDCKVSGTVDGVTAVQMDVKLAGGVPLAVVGRVLDEARAARVGILATMAEAAPEQAKGLPHGAPRSISVPVDRQLVIKTLLRDRAAGLKEIELASRSRLFLEQDGATPVIRVDAPSAASAEDALRLLRESLADIEVGTKLRGRVVDVRPAYALVETQAGALTGMLHVSKMNLAVPTAPAPLGGGKTPDQLRYPDVRRVLRVGEELEVVCVESERQKGVLRFGLLADPRLGAGGGDAFLEEVRGSPLKENMPPAGAPTDRRRLLQRES